MSHLSSIAISVRAWFLSGSTLSTSSMCPSSCASHTSHLHHFSTIIYSPQLPEFRFLLLPTQLLSLCTHSSVDSDLVLVVICPNFHCSSASLAFIPSSCFPKVSTHQVRPRIDCLNSTVCSTAFRPCMFCVVSSCIISRKMNVLPRSRQLLLQIIFIPTTSIRCTEFQILNGVSSQGNPLFQHSLSQLTIGLKYVKLI